MTVSLTEHVASPKAFTAVQRYRSESSPVSLLICGEAKGRGAGLTLPSSMHYTQLWVGSMVMHRHGLCPHEAHSLYQEMQTSEQILDWSRGWMFLPLEAIWVSQRAYSSRVGSNEPGPGDHLCHVLLAMRPWASSPTSINFNFLAYEMGIIISQKAVNGQD